MARENSFMFFGKLAEAPVVFQNEETKKYQVSISIETLRRNGRKDYPRVSSYGLEEQEARDFVRDLKIGVYIICRGMITTRVVDKPIKCSKCGEISKIKTLFTEVVTYGKPYVLKQDVNPKEIVEFSNLGTALGTLCTEVKRIDGVNGMEGVQFQVALGRRYRIAEQTHDSLTDYPWVKCFGAVARGCIERLEKGSQIYITGSFQTRDIHRNVKCAACGQLLKTLERIGEIVPNGVEFLNNCLFDEKSPKDREGKEAVKDEKA